MKSNKIIHSGIKTFIRACERKNYLREVIIIDIMFNSYVFYFADDKQKKIHYGSFSLFSTE